MLQYSSWSEKKPEWKILKSKIQIKPHKDFLLKNFNEFTIDNPKNFYSQKTGFTMILKAPK